MTITAFLSIYVYHVQHCLTCRFSDTVQEDTVRKVNAWLHPMEFVSTVGYKMCLIQIQHAEIKFPLLSFWTVDAGSEPWARIFKRLWSPKIDSKGMNSASLRSMAGRYENPIPTRFLAP
jgi:hypothetical protein